MLPNVRRIVVEPERLRELSATLKRCASELEAEERQLSARWASLDAESRRLDSVAPHVDEGRKRVRTLGQGAAQMAKFLETKANAFSHADGQRETLASLIGEGHLGLQQMAESLGIIIGSLNPLKPVEPILDLGSILLPFHPPSGFWGEPPHVEPVPMPKFTGVGGIPPVPMPQFPGQGPGHYSSGPHIGCRRPWINLNPLPEPEYLWYAANNGRAGGVTS